jgi:hypothetical protein
LKWLPNVEEREPLLSVFQSSKSVVRVGLIKNFVSLVMQRNERYEQAVLAHINEAYNNLVSTVDRITRYAGPGGIEVC